MVSPMLNIPDLEAARAAVRGGGVVAYPTEAVYGLGCDPLDERAVARIAALKGRPTGKGFILIASHFSQLAPFCAVIGNAAWRRVKQTWPGPHTWVFPRTLKCPPWLHDRSAGIAVRVSAHPVAAALCDVCNCALVSTSANLSGQPPLRTAREVADCFGEQLDCIVEGDVGGAAAPTAIRDAASGRLIRQGADEANDGE